MMGVLVLMGCVQSKYSKYYYVEGNDHISFEYLRNWNAPNSFVSYTSNIRALEIQNDDELVFIFEAASIPRDYEPCTSDKSIIYCNVEAKNGYSRMDRTKEYQSEDQITYEYMTEFNFPDKTYNLFAKATFSNNDVNMELLDSLEHSVRSISYKSI